MKIQEIRSDLAVELCDHIRGHISEPEGIKCSETKCGRMKLETVSITTPEGASLVGKPLGTYLTLSTGKLWLDDRDSFREKVLSFSLLLRNMIREKVDSGKTVLVAGLGNEFITADAIGPETAKNLVVTRHIRSERPLMFAELGLSDLCAVMPGVLGQTGIESADVVGSIVERIKPGLVIAVDALASRNPERLVTTIQLCDSGIRPGSGIGNGRPALTPEELKVPIITVGVPTVVDAAILAADAIRRFSGRDADAEEIRKEWRGSDLNFFVTPKETDQIIRVMGSFIGYSINLALNEELSYEDMLSLVG